MGFACTKAEKQTYAINSPEDINEFAKEQKENTNLKRDVGIKMQS